jgi:hypothetical protein
VAAFCDSVVLIFVSSGEFNLHQPPKIRREVWRQGQDGVRV